MSSHSSKLKRRTPQQERSTQRVGEILQAAESLFSEAGFEATTMTAVAERAASSIGGLYGYFPDKRSLALALLDIYAGQIEKQWQPLFASIGPLSAEEFAEHFIDRFLGFISEHPAFLQMVAAPVQLRRSAAAKRAFRAPLIEALRRRVPTLSQQQAELSANVTLQIMHGLTQMFKDAEPKERAPVVAEFKKVLSAYLSTLFGA